MNYVYLIAYQHLHGYGNVDVTRAEPITDPTDIREIESHLAHNNGAEGVAVMFFTLLRSPAET